MKFYQESNSIGGDKNIMKKEEILSSMLPKVKSYYKLRN
jgi:hypothetical protein